MTEGQWIRVAYGSIAAVIAAFLASGLNLPGADVVGPWLLLLGLAGGVVSVIGGLRARRRARLEAEAGAAAELDRLDRTG